MVQPAQDQLRDYVSKPLDRPRAGRVLAKQKVRQLRNSAKARSHLINVAYFARMRRRCSALNPIKWSVHSRRIDPIRRSTCPFCPGDWKDVGLSRIPIARTRALNAAPNARSRCSLGSISIRNSIFDPFPRLRTWLGVIRLPRSSWP